MGRNLVSSLLVVVCFLFVVGVAPPLSAQSGELHKLTPDVMSDPGRFGHAVALSPDGRLMATGASAKLTAGGAMTGAVYVYRLVGDTWIQEPSFTASNASSGDLFGHAVAVDEDTVIVGAPGQGRGSVYVFHLDGSQWVEQQRLFPHR